MSNQQGGHSIAPDVNGILLVAGSWTQTLLLNASLGGMIKVGMFLMSSLFTLLAIVDYLMKIHWKMKQRSKEKAGQHAITAHELHGVMQELVKEIKRMKAGDASQ